MITASAEMDQARRDITWIQRHPSPAEHRPTPVLPNNYVKNHRAEYDESCVRKMLS